MDSTHSTFKNAEAALQENTKTLEYFQGNWPNTIKQLELEKELRNRAPILESAVKNAQQDFETTQARQHRAREARLGIGQEYHPYDLKTGAPQDAAEVQAKLNNYFDTLDQVASEASLKQSSLARLAKAKRVLPLMVSTIAFFWSLLDNRL